MGMTRLPLLSAVEFIFTHFVPGATFGSTGSVVKDPEGAEPDDDGGVGGGGVGGGGAEAVDPAVSRGGCWPTYSSSAAPPSPAAPQQAPLPSERAAPATSAVLVLDAHGLPAAEEEVRDVTRILPFALVKREASLASVKELDGVSKLHVVGHMNPSLAVMHRNGLDELVTPGAFAAAIPTSLTHAVLNMCFTAELGSRLYDQGVSAVYCWETMGADEASALFAKGVWEAIAAGRSDLEAFEAGKNAIITHTYCPASSPFYQVKFEIGAFASTLLPPLHPRHAPLLT